MVSTELIDYIKYQLSQGKTQEEIVASLSIEGWSEADVNLAFSQSITIQPATTQSPTNIEDVPQTPTEKYKNIFDFKNMKWYEWLAMLPAFILLVQGGAIGAMIGAFGWSISFKIIRNESRSKVAKIFFVVGTTIAYYVLYFIIAAILFGLLNQT
jgi:hypothetical protein